MPLPTQENQVQQSLPASPEPSAPQIPAQSAPERQAGEPNQAVSTTGAAQTGQIPAPAGSSVLDLLRNQGYDTSGYSSDQDFIGYLNQVQQYLPQVQQYLPQVERLAAFGQQVMPYAQDFEAYLAQQRAAAGQPTAPQPQQPAAPAEQAWWPKAPEWNPDWERYLAVDANGNVVVKDPSVTSPTLVQKYHEHQKWRRDRMEALLNNPLEAIKPGLEEMIQEMAKKQAQDLLDEHRNHQFANSWAAANQDLFFVRGTGGQQVLSQVGQAVLQNIQRLEAAGVTDTVQQAQLAQELAYAQLGPEAFQAVQQSPAGQNGMGQQQPTPVQQQPTGPDPKERFLRGNGFSPNRSNTISQAALPHVPQNPGLNYREQLRQNARNRGLIHDE